MRKRTGSIKFRVVAVVVLFTLASTVAAVSVSLRQFQEDARRSALQSSEFNLNLVAGLVSQELDELDRLRTWCGAQEGIGAYISGKQASAAAGARASDDINKQVLQNEAYKYLLRLVVVSEDYQRILQSGSGTTAGIPLTPYSINRLERLELVSGGSQWSGIVVDPFTDVGGSHMLYSCGHIFYGSGKNRAMAGHIFLMVSTSIITEPISSYQLPEGCRLYLTVGNRSFSLNGSLNGIEPPVSSTPTGDATLNPHTEVSWCIGQDGEEFLAVSCPIGSSGVWITQTISSQALTATLQSVYGRQMLLLILFSAFIGAVVLLVLNRTINRPIITLQSRMSAIAEGDFTPDPTIEWNNELGDVGRGINHLSQSVQGLMERRLADEKDRQDLEYQILQSQINPHFLYNSLNSIKWMATLQSADGIAEMTTSLAHLMKSVAKIQQVLIPLSEELSLFRDYFVIQKYRYGGSITMAEEIEPGLDATLIPRFTLQPLLENAIFHGIEPKGAGSIRLTARRTPAGVELTIADDGVGMEQSRADALLSGQVKGPDGLFRRIGLNNVHSRIQYEFGREYGLSIQSEPGKFTCINVRLPFVTGEETEGEDVK